MRKEKVRIKKYEDVAYIDGYANGLGIFLIDNIEELKLFPYYYIYGLKKDIKNFGEYKSIIKSNKIFHKSAYEHSVKLISKMEIGENKCLPTYTIFVLGISTLFAPVARNQFSCFAASLKPATLQ